MYFRKAIFSRCFNPFHPFPVSMRYAGTQMQRNGLVHLMICPICGRTQRYVYINRYRYEKVG